MTGGELVGAGETTGRGCRSTRWGELRVGGWMDELACFAPGMLALGSFGYDPGDREKMLTAKLQRRHQELTQTTPDQPVDDDAVYYKVAGECPKGRVYGLRSLGRKKRRYVDPDASTSQPCVTFTCLTMVATQNGFTRFNIVWSFDLRSPETPTLGAHYFDTIKRYL
ncbi:hypothetical protein Syun_020816 [Stephania yunnanensis]|uniref:Uncharacterized protein n=1 Tax=Stephania yunnanensis TaxID=152371 RepID=A0AAP0IEI6_9MAGN